MTEVFGCPKCALQILMNVGSTFIFIVFYSVVYLLNCCLYPPAGLSSLGVPGVPWHTQSLADQLTLFQPGGTDYAHLITTGTPGFSDLPTAL
jgi:hypothetical protein